jgi:1-acyl-sn-glycerol-3-phosphate acyltransferase
VIDDYDCPILRSLFALKIEWCVVTLNVTFVLPIWREILLLLGYISSSRATLLSTLQEKSVVLVPGGAKEALYTHPGTLKLVLKKRMGFIKLALKAKVPLVPCICFGENEIFDTVPFAAISNKDAMPLWEKLLWRLQQSLKKVLHFTVPIVTNPLPNPIQVTVVDREPLELDYCRSVEENNALYLQHLSALYEQNKTKYGYDDVKLEFV